MQKVTLWFAMLLLALAAPPIRHAHAGQAGRLLTADEQVLWAGATLGTARYTPRLGNSSVPGTRASACRSASVTKAPAPTESHPLDAAAVGAPITLPCELLSLVAELDALAPEFSVAKYRVRVPRARGPPA